MEIAAGNIDKLINIEMRRTGLPLGKKWVLWEVARAISPEPLVLAAARLLNRDPSDIAIVAFRPTPMPPSRLMQNIVEWTLDPPRVRKF